MWLNIFCKIIYFGEIKTIIIQSNYLWRLYSFRSFQRWKEKVFTAWYFIHVLVSLSESYSQAVSFWAFFFSVPVIPSSLMFIHNVRSDMLPHHSLGLRSYDTNTQLIRYKSSIDQNMLILLDVSSHRKLSDSLKFGMWSFPGLKWYL